MSQTLLEAAEDQQKQQSEDGSLSLSAADFSGLEERVVRTVELVKRERQARTEAEERATKAETQIAEQDHTLDQQKQEIRALRTERDQVRQRVERLLSQLDALEL
jgi:uncharacterized coiled-coil protein SlyX